MFDGDGLVEGEEAEVGGRKGSPVGLWLRRMFVEAERGLVMDLW